MFENLKKAFKSSKDVWNFSGYWVEVVFEYQKITGWDLEQSTRHSSEDKKLLDEFCQRAMKKGLTARDCAFAISQQGFADPNVLDRPTPAEIDEEDDEPISYVGPFDERNRRLAPIYHAFLDEVEEKQGYSVLHANHPQLHELTENEFQRGISKFKNRSDIERNFNFSTRRYARILHSRSGQSYDDPHGSGIEIALVIVFRILFGFGPAYAHAVQADVSVVTVGILTQVLAHYRSLSSDNSDFAEGATWAIAGFLRRCEAPAAQVTKAKEVQRHLTELFAEHGVDYMSLHPVIHRALLDEALAFGRVERTVEMFFETAVAVQEKSASDEERAQILLDIWRVRGELYRR